MCIASRTPLISGGVERDLQVVHLGETDMGSPIAALVVSEEVNVPRFDPSSHGNMPACIVSFSGCDADVLKNASILESDIPILSLPEVWSAEQYAEFHGVASFADFVNKHSLDPEQVSDQFRNHFEKNCQNSEETALFIADCVVAFINVASRFSQINKKSLI